MTVTENVKKLKFIKHISFNYEIQTQRSAGVNWAMNSVEIGEDFVHLIADSLSLLSGERFGIFGEASIALLRVIPLYQAAMATDGKGMRFAGTILCVNEWTGVTDILKTYEDKDMRMREFLLHDGKSFISGNVVLKDTTVIKRDKD